MLFRKKKNLGEWMWTVHHSLSLGIIAFLPLLQAHGNNHAWCQVIGENYIGKSVQWQNWSVRMQWWSLLIRITHTAAYSQNDVDLMSCKGSSWTQTSNLTLIKWCTLQKAYSECIYGLSPCLKILTNFIWHGMLGVGEKSHSFFFPVIKWCVFLIRII